MAALSQHGPASSAHSTAPFPYFSRLNRHAYDCWCCGQSDASSSTTDSQPAHHAPCFPSSAESLDLSRLAENSSSLVLRLDSEEQADLWYRHLQQAQQAMRELAGEGTAQLLPDWEEASSTVSGAEAEEASAGLAASQVLLSACLASQ